MGSEEKAVASHHIAGDDRVLRLLGASFVVSLGTMMFGFNLGYSSPALVDFHSNSSTIHLDSSQEMWFTALLPLGALFGSLITGWIMELSGRKTAQMIAAFPLATGAALVTSAQGYEMLYAGRFVSGLGTGMVSLSTPVYIAELSSSKLRGSMASISQLALGFGFVVAFSVSLVLHWRWLSVVGVASAATMTILMLFLPETPRWLIANNLDHMARQAMLWVRKDSPDIDTEIEDIQEGLDSSEEFSLKDIFRPHFLKPLLIGSGLLFFQQFSGINSITFNCATIMGNAGFTNEKTVSLVIPLIQFVGTLFVVFLVDRTGRRILLLLGVALNLVSLVVVGAYFYVKAHPSLTDFPDWIAVISLGAYALGFALGLGPVPWVVVSEIFPHEARGAAGGVAAMVGWLSSFIVVLTYKVFKESLNEYGVFWFYAGCCFLAFIFIFILLPETKGRTLEEIEELFNH